MTAPVTATQGGVVMTIESPTPGGVAALERLGWKIEGFSAEPDGKARKSLTGTGDK